MSARDFAHQPLWQQAGVRHYLHCLRKQHGLSRAELAKIIGYSTATLNAWERGYQSPNFVQLQEWAQAFEMRVFLAPVTAGNQPTTQEREQRAICLEEQRSA